MWDLTQLGQFNDILITKRAHLNKTSQSVTLPRGNTLRPSKNFSEHIHVLSLRLNLLSQISDNHNLPVPHRNSSYGPRKQFLKWTVHAYHLPHW